MLDQVFTAEPVPFTLDDDDIWNIHSKPASEISSALVKKREIKGEGGVKMRRDFVSPASRRLTECVGTSRAPPDHDSINITTSNRLLPISHRHNSAFKEF